MKASQEHYELMQTQFEENLRKTYEEKLLKINENAVGNLAPHGVYGGGNPWMKPKMDVKRENTSLPSDSATANCGWLLSGPPSGNTAAKVTTDGNSQKVKSGQKPNFMIKLWVLPHQRWLPSMENRNGIHTLCSST